MKMISIYPRTNKKLLSMFKKWLAAAVIIASVYCIRKIFKGHKFYAIRKCFPYICLANGRYRELKIKRNWNHKCFTLNGCIGEYLYSWIKPTCLAHGRLRIVLHRQSDRLSEIAYIG